VTVVVRTQLADPTRLVASIRAVLRDMDAEVPLANAETMEAVVDRSIARTSFTMLLLSVAASMALVLSAVGLYGVVAYLVAQRRREIGVRIALGARVGQVSRLVVLESLRLAGAGVVIGLAGALVVTHVLRSMLYEVSPTDPLVLALVCGMLLLVATVASWAPARRAARLDPVEALRSE
jgi:ABC-type antimicrobial peptide transport system permease subunit